MKNIFKELSKRNGVASERYGEYVSQKVRERYTVNEELAILRQRDSKPEEFAQYNAYVEECKALVKAELGV